jgi:hypothetical protein
MAVVGLGEGGREPLTLFDVGTQFVMAVADVMQMSA